MNSEAKYMFGAILQTFLLFAAIFSMAGIAIFLSIGIGGSLILTIISELYGLTFTALVVSAIFSVLAVFVILVTAVVMCIRAYDTP